MGSLWPSLPVRLFVLFTSLAFIASACASAPVSPSVPVAEATAVPTALPTATPAPTIAPTTAPTATAAPTATPAAISVTDALGRVVTLPQPPQRVVLTGRGLFMIANAIYAFPNASDRIVGMGQTNQGSANFIKLIDPAYEQKATLERDAGAEQIAALQPDLVIMKSTMAKSLGEPIEALGIPIVFVDLETPEQYWQDIAMLGNVFQSEARATEIVNFYRSKVEAIQQAVADAAKPRALVLYYNDRDSPVSFNVPPLNWIQTTMVEIAGGEPVWADANPGGGWTQVTLEQIAAWDADHIFIISYFRNPSEVIAELKADPNWQAIRATKEGNLHAFPGDLYIWAQPDVRWLLGLEWLAGKLHPDRFSDLDMVAEVKEFYNVLYGLDAAFVEQRIVPTFQGDLP